MRNCYKNHTKIRFVIGFIIIFSIVLYSFNPCVFATGTFIDINSDLDNDKNIANNESGNNEYNVTIIGDSVTLSSASAIRSIIPSATIDVEISRTMKMGIDIIDKYMQNGDLSEYVVIALATNTHNDTNNAATKIIESIADGHKLIFVTAYGKDFMKPATEFIRQLPSVYPFISVADWEAVISPKNNLLAADRVHPSKQEAKELYAQCLFDAIREASEKPAKGEPNITVVYDGSVINFTKPPVDKNGIIFFPLKSVLQAFTSIGVDEWYEDTILTQMGLNGNEVKVMHNDLSYVINDSELEDNDFSPFKNGTEIYVYLDLIIEGLGMNVEWNDVTRTLTIKKI